MLFYLIAIGFLAIAATTVGRRFGLKRNAGDPNQAWRPVDVPAFYMLVDPSETGFLAEQLPQAEFRRHHRRRMATAWEYLGHLSHNARLVVHTGQMMLAMSAGPNVEIEKVIELAVSARQEILRMQFRVAQWYVFPGMHVDLLPGLQSYRDMEASSGPLVRPIEVEAQWVH